MTEFPLMDKCDEKAKTQPHFTLLAKDDFTPGLVTEWIRKAKLNGTPKAKLDEAESLLERIEQWRRFNPTLCKIPD